MKTYKTFHPNQSFQGILTSRKQMKERVFTGGWVRD